MTYVESIGIGRPSEGVIAERRGERVRIYPTKELRSAVAQSLAYGLEWEPVGLPPKLFPLVSAGRESFTTSGDIIVGHGGISIEEVIVPLVKIERKKR